MASLPRPLRMARHPLRSDGMAVLRGFRLGDGEALLAPRIVITMPAYNAEATLARTVADIPAGIADQLILVDDASPDNTAELARGLGIDVHVHPENRGYGENQKTCYTMALRDDADIVVMLHPDYQYEPKAVPLLIAPILAGDADMTFGSRFAGLGDPRSGGMPIQRYLGNRVTTILENLMLGSRFTEMHSGMRAYTRRCLLSLPFLRYSGDFLFDSQFLIDAVTTGQRVVEVPIPTRYTDESSSIGTLPSLTYIAGSVGYCARRVASHGRKRHRSPIGRRDAGAIRELDQNPPREQVCALCGVSRIPVDGKGDGTLECSVCGLVSSAEQWTLAARRDPVAPLTGDDGAFLEWVLGAMSGYVVRGNKLLGIGMRDPGHLRLTISADWQPTAVAVRDEGSALVDAVLVLAISDLADSYEGLGGLRSLVDDEGLLVFVSPTGPGGKRAGRALPYSIRAERFDGALREAGFRLVEWTRLPRAPARGYGQWLAPGARGVAALARADIAFAVARPIRPGPGVS